MAFEPSLVANAIRQVGPTVATAIATAPVVSDPYSDIFHKVIAGLLIMLTGAVATQFWRMNTKITNLDARHVALEARVEKNEQEVSKVGPELTRIAESLATKIDERADDTNDKILALSEKVGFLRGRTERDTEREGA